MLFNTVKDPLFSARDVNLCLKGTTRNAERNYQYLLDDEIFNNQYIKNPNKGNRVEFTTLLNEDGLFHFCYLEKTGVAKIVQKFMKEIIHQLREDGVATVAKAHAALKKQYKQEIIRRREAEAVNDRNMQIADALYNTEAFDEEPIELNYLRRRLMTQYYVYVASWEMVNTAIWKKYPPKEKKILPPPKNNRHQIADELEGVDLYSSDEEDAPAARSRTKIDTTEPHIRSLQLYEHTFVSYDDLKTYGDEQYYFLVTDKKVSEKDKHKYKFIRMIYIDKDKSYSHYKEMLEILKYGEEPDLRTAYKPDAKYNPDAKAYKPVFDRDSEIYEDFETPIRKVYRTTYAQIMSSRNRAIAKQIESAMPDIKKYDESKEQEK